jgi:hypothetical protein
MSKQQNVFTDLVNAGELSRLKGWNYDVFADQATLLAKTYPLTAADGAASFHIAMDSATSKVWYFNGSQTNSDTTSPANETHWFSGDSDREIVLQLANPPIASFNGATQVTGVTPTNLTSNTKFITWTDGSGKVHMYQVSDPLGTPVFKEITSNSFLIIEDATLVDVASVEALAPLRKHTLYKNPDTEATFLVDEEGNVEQLSSANKIGSIVFETAELVAGTEKVFDINADATIDFQDGEVATAGANEEALHKLLLVNGVEVFDTANSQQLNTNSYAIRPIDAKTFGITVNSDTTVDVTVSCMLKKSLPV